MPNYTIISSIPFRNSTLTSIPSRTPILTSIPSRESYFNFKTKNHLITNGPSFPPTQQISTKIRSEFDITLVKLRNEIYYDSM